MTPILHAENLSFQFGGEPLLTGIGLSVMPGDFVAVTGSNGAGKSTLFRLLLGELAPHTGGIRLFGQELEKFKDWSKIGYVPQNNPVSGGSFPATAEEIVCANMYSQIGAFRPVRKSHRTKAREALRLMGMQDSASRLISELSGGQLQRVMIARSLAAGCELLMLDEPTTGIDSESVGKLYKLLSELNRSGMTVLMVTHDMSRASEYVSRILCLESGTVVELDHEQLELELELKHKHKH